MKYGFIKVNINPSAPTYTVGFGGKKQKVSQTRLDLNLRLLRLIDDQTDLVLLSLDSLNVSYDICQLFKQQLQHSWKGCQVIISATHTHYAPSLVNQFPLYKVDRNYLALVQKRLQMAIHDLELKEIDGKVDYHYSPCVYVGTSRINRNDNQNVYAGVLSFYDRHKRLGSLLFYNCHPTVDDPNADYFSSDYVGFTVQRLEHDHPKEFFLFLQGACGDVSSRYVRKEKSFKESSRLGDILANYMNDLIRQNKPNAPLVLHYRKEDHDFDFHIKSEADIPQEFVNSPEVQSNKTTIRLLSALKMLKNTRIIPKSSKVELAELRLGDYYLLFSPFELFSCYNRYISKQDTLLVGYSNGALAYVTAPNNEQFTYESIMETTCESDKQIIVNTIETIKQSV